jgi:Fe-S-cluster containining protein
MEQSIINSEAVGMPCRRCGVCCTRHQPYAKENEIERITAFLWITREEWNRTYDDPRWQFDNFRLIKHNENGCLFLRYENGLAACSIYSVRPACCSDWVPGPERRECREGMKRRKHENQNNQADGSD